MEAVKYKTDDFELLAKIYSNLGYVNLELKNYGKVVDNCNKCLEYKKDFIKVYYRKSRALFLLKKY